MRSYIVWRLASDIRPGDQERGKNRLQLLPWSVFCVWAFSFWPDPLEDDEEKYQSKWNQDRYVSFRWENGARVIVVEKSKMKKIIRSLVLILSDDLIRMITIQRFHHLYSPRECWLHLSPNHKFVGRFRVDEFFQRFSLFLPKNRRTFEGTRPNNPVYFEL